MKKLRSEKLRADFPFSKYDGIFLAIGGVLAHLSQRLVDPTPRASEFEPPPFLEPPQGLSEASGRFFRGLGQPKASVKAKNSK